MSSWLVRLYIHWARQTPYFLEDVVGPILADCVDLMSVRCQPLTFKLHKPCILTAQPVFLPHRSLQAHRPVKAAIQRCDEAISVLLQLSQEIGLAVLTTGVQTAALSDRRGVLTDVALAHVSFRE